MSSFFRLPWSSSNSDKSKSSESEQDKEQEKEDLRRQQTLLASTLAEIEALERITRKKKK